MQPVTVTYLEMRSPAELVPSRVLDAHFSVDELVEKRWQRNRGLYLAVGRDWSWTDKERWTEAQWRAYVESEGLRTFLAQLEGAEAGYYELRRHDKTDVEIAILGLLPGFIGRGLGGMLLTDALRRAWSMDPRRVWLHTCNLDHPAALSNYLARGLKVYRVETSPC